MNLFDHYEEEEEKNHPHPQVVLCKEIPLLGFSK